MELCSNCKQFELKFKKVDYICYCKKYNQNCKDVINNCKKRKIKNE